MFVRLIKQQKHKNYTHVILSAVVPSPNNKEL